MVRALTSFPLRKAALVLGIGAAALWPLHATGEESPPSTASGAATDATPTGAPQATGKNVVPGYLDAETGTFQRLTTAPGSVTRSGTIQIVGTITLNPGIPTTAKISVSPYFGFANATTIGQIFGVPVTAKRTGPHSATFSATIRYTCVMPSATSPVNISLDISTSAPGTGGMTISWDGSWGSVVTLPPDGKTLTVKANTAV